MERFRLFIKTKIRLILFIVILVIVAAASVIGIMKNTPPKKPDDGRPKTVTVLNDEGETKRMPNFVNTDVQPETEPATSEETEVISGDKEQAEVTYILNKSRHKFHLPSCSSVAQIAEHNKEEFTGTRDELIAEGYEPCKLCNP